MAGGAGLGEALFAAVLAVELPLEPTAELASACSSSAGVLGFDSTGDIGVTGRTPFEVETIPDPLSLAEAGDVDPADGGTTGETPGPLAVAFPAEVLGSAREVLERTTSTATIAHVLREIEGEESHDGVFPVRPPGPR